MTDLNNFGKVAVFCGGSSHEREISLQSGAAVTAGLQQAGVSVQLVDTIDKDFDVGEYDRAFIALHGRDGEDGKIQALLDFHGVPYTGSSMTASAVSMNKWYTKSIWQSIGIRTPEYRVVGKALATDTDDITYPVYVKPVNEGSSIGISRVQDVSALSDAISLALEYDEFVLIEQAIEGKEYTFSFIDGMSKLPLICLQPATDFYDYAAKYTRDDTQYIVSPPLDAALRDQCIADARLAYQSIGMGGWGRVDFMIDEHDKAWFIEVNSVPGMTNHSLVPMSAKAAGHDFSATCLSILRGATHD